MRQIRFQSSAKRDLARLAEPDARGALDAIEAYATSGIGKVKKLKGYKPPA
jgi:hypothetical protein